jgi:hypothetical protein
MTLMCMGGAFFACMGSSALLFRSAPTPAPVLVASIATTPNATTATAATGVAASPSAVSSDAIPFNVHFRDAMRTPQFWQVWVVFASLATAGTSHIVFCLSAFFLHG